MNDQYGKPHRRNLITCINVNNALPQGISLLKHFGRPAAPRGMKVLEMEMPIMTQYLRPDQCVLIDDTRLCNPFFHLIEALWILNGRSNVSTLKFYNAKMADYSDDGKTFYGAYGQRLRGGEFNPDSVFANGFGGYEQLTGVIQKLTDDQMSRQAVAVIWDVKDLYNQSKDIPCNDMLMFTLRNGRLDMTIICRSNDVIWGAYGANAVQFSFIMQYVAAGLGAKVGAMFQMSNNYHVYTEDNGADLWKKLSTDKWLKEAHDPYGSMNLKTCPLIATTLPDGTVLTPEQAVKMFDHENNLFLELVDNEIELLNNDKVSAMSTKEFYEHTLFKQPFFYKVALPLHIVWMSRKMRKYSGEKSDEWFGHTTTSTNFDEKIDWLAAALQWCDVTDKRAVR